MFTPRFITAVSGSYMTKNEFPGRYGQSFVSNDDGFDKFTCMIERKKLLKPIMMFILYFVDSDNNFFLITM